MTPVSAHCCRPGGWFKYCGQDFYGGCLAGAVGPQHTEGFALVNLEAYVVYRFNVAIAFNQVFYIDNHGRTFFFSLRHH